jgi:hypothetical protein
MGKFGPRTAQRRSCASGHVQVAGVSSFVRPVFSSGSTSSSPRSTPREGSRFFEELDSPVCGSGLAGTSLDEPALRGRAWSAASVRMTRPTSSSTTTWSAASVRMTRPTSSSTTTSGAVPKGQDHPPHRGGVGQLHRHPEHGRAPQEPDHDGCCPEESHGRLERARARLRSRSLLTGPDPPSMRSCLTKVRMPARDD